MSEVCPINYDTVSWAIKLINEILIRSGQVLAVEVNAKNEIVAAGVIEATTALTVGFNPVQFVNANHQPHSTAGR